MDFDEMRNAYKRATEQDITDRLKSLIGANYATWDIDVDNAMQESIEEIERLRAELKRWQTCEMVVEEVCGWDSEQTYCDTCKAVRGE